MVRMGHECHVTIRRCDNRTVCVNRPTGRWPTWIAMTVPKRHECSGSGSAPASPTPPSGPAGIGPVGNDVPAVHLAEPHRVNVTGRWLGDQRFIQLRPVVPVLADGAADTARTEVNHLERCLFVVGIVADRIEPSIAAREYDIFQWSPVFITVPTLTHVPSHGFSAQRTGSE